MFVRRVLTLAPAFTALSLEFGGSRPDTHLTLLHQTFLTELLVGADKYALSDTYTVAYVNDFPIVPGNLVRLFFRGAALSLFHEALIRRNALSLESLVVTMAIVDTSCWIFNSSADSLAIYPLLKYLRVSFPSNADNYGWPDISDLVPFPKLAALHMNGYYPFKDGVFFRGNRSSLRYVTLPFNMLVRDIIGNNDVFAYGRSNCLRCIAISAVARQDTIDLFIGGTRNIDQQLSQIAASASRLVYRPGNAARKDLIRVFSFQRGFERLEHLELSNRPMAVRDVADLLSCLPRLSSLNCNLCKNVFTADRVDVDEWLGKFYSRIYPLNRRFKSWTTQPSQGMALRHFARGVMLIAVLCPSFYFVRMQQDIRAAFNREAAWATFTVPFKKYAARLRDIVLRVGIADGVASGAGMELDL
ncbi:hypothetical protein IWW39_005614 [Coemansia spiralis]|uniref:Uncharacterized protein n=1 Tax=Coemansia spiralis TaxID=417178 RepID=A0A9W8GE65_9FUNG|nr:hypothetical protein IWW39_005614 [Coemansia spiralis]